MNNLVIALLALTATAFIGLATIALLQKKTPAARFFAAMVGLAAIWAITYIGELNSSSLSTKIGFLQVRLMFICFIPFAWLGLVLSLTGRFHLFKKTFIILLLIVPTATALLALTTQLHTQFRYDFAIKTIHGLDLLTYKRSSWDMFHEVSNHLVSLLGFFILLSAWHSSSGLMRKQTTLLAISFIIPLTANMLFVFNIIPSIGINPTPFVLLPSSLLQAWVVLHSRLLDITPVARSIVLDQINIGMILLDSNNRVADINPAAQVITESSETDALGKLIENLPPPWNHLNQLSQKKNDPIRIEQRGKRYWIEPEFFPISPGGELTNGTVILLKDVTSDVLRRKENLLKRKYKERQKQHHLQQLLLRDIHDGLGGLTSNLLYMAVFAQKENDPAKKNEWLQKIEKTSAETNSEIRSLMNALENTFMTWGELIESVRKTANTLLDNQSSSIDFQIQNIPRNVEVGITEGLSLSRMICECMNNIVKHAQATEVTFRINITSEQIHILITDNGLGFDPKTVTRGRGLNHLEKRAAELGGHFSITTTDKTQQTIIIPRPLHIIPSLDN